MKFLRNNRGAAVVEFGVLALPVIGFIFAIIEFGYVLWADNLLNVAVDTAARCGAIQSTTSPCNGTDMITTAKTVFKPLTATSFTNNANCSADSGSGLVGKYNVSIGVWIWAVDLTLTANSCYPTVS